MTLNFLNINDFNSNKKLVMRGQNRMQKKLQQDIEFRNILILTNLLGSSL